MLNPAEAEALVRDSVAALQRGDAAAARTGLERITATGRANAQIWLILATALRRLGDEAEGAVHRRVVDGVVVWGLRAPECAPWYRVVAGDPKKQHVIEIRSSGGELLGTVPVGPRSGGDHPSPTPADLAVGRQVEALGLDWDCEVPAPRGIQA
jgi:hypothetical protein